MTMKRIAIIGGGAAGMVAAIAAARKDQEVVLLEKGPKLGYKVLISGNGSCNLTNHQKEIPLRDFIHCFPGNGKFLYGALSRMDPEATMRFFEELGVALTVERGGRVFPLSKKSKDLVDALEREIRRLGVEVKLNSRVSKIEKEGDSFRILLSGGASLEFDKVVIATGGKSFPGTGSTGDGYSFAKSLEHTVVPTFPALVPLKIPSVVSLAGLSLRNVKAAILEKGKVLAEEQGEMLFTHTGVSGPIVLTLSRLVSQKKEVSLFLRIDFKPALSREQVDAGLLRDWNKNPRQLLSNALRERLPFNLIPFVLAVASIPAERVTAEVKKEERKKLVETLKGWLLPIDGVLPIETAIVTAGGVEVKEIDPKSMESKKVPGLYWAGEVIDIDGVTGGYNLQAAWSTGFLAGESAAKDHSPCKFND
ncbi:MAG TPA: aminoacetone oxidase family FAD-binding enzyme [Cyanobacteria bacterium UBA8530]|nr:aminoacetone oxidase family FAD-binding enzyme [Cyanobacteria bacterium UBA8530]